MNLIFPTYVDAICTWIVSCVDALVPIVNSVILQVPLVSWYVFRIWREITFIAEGTSGPLIDDKSKKS